MTNHSSMMAEIMFLIYGRTGIQVALKWTKDIILYM